MCDVLSGGPGMCDNVRQGGVGSKLAKNSVTYFMDGPYGAVTLFQTQPLQLQWRS